MSAATIKTDDPPLPRKSLVFYSEVGERNIHPQKRRFHMRKTLSESLFKILCKCLFSKVTVQAVTELDNKAAHCHSQSFNGIVHFWDADWIASHTTFFTESSVGNTLRFLIAWRITLFSDLMAFVV